MLRRVNSFSRTIGKQRQQFHFELSHIEIESGTPSSRSAPSLVIQIGRGDKTTTSKEVEAPQSEGAGLPFDGQKLSFRATLFSSKSGNATDYSEKLYKIAVLAVKPDFGTTKTVFKELAAAELDVAEYALSTEPFKVTLNCRGDRRNKIVVQFYICAWPVAAGDDDDDDDASEPAAGSGVSGLTPTTAKPRPEPEAAENEKFLNALVRTKEQEVAKVSRERDEARARLTVLEEEFKLLEEKVSSARGEARARLVELDKVSRERDEFRTQLGLAEELKAAAKLEELNQMMMSINPATHEDAQGAEGESEDEADEGEPPSADGADQAAEEESEEDADEAQPPSPDEPSDDGVAVVGGKAAWNPRYIGNWVQESIEADKLDAILKIQGYNYPTRKIVTSVKLSMTFTRDSDGDLFLVMKDPTGSNRLKCIDGAKLVVKNMGATLINTAQWEAGNLVVNLETHKGKTVTTAKITQRYDPATDKIYSENDSIEGFYVRTFKRSKKGPQAGDE
ncbi:hypothetical protein Ctob_015487 [Chrysochromulina tobinii]|uniref:C2 NT-type domain-containing protein n=1 Tax=Chrysochromulina tobinii TaxID=1460289 RepID=A0A0M0LSD9_9EUKA|nr:hypothetical protein Ctob_015487 [Chrysochromulina tobinii]|eukprot:KOO53832.1 hypothetical protein Ctob_015487 [Chrysochromulina sp. CCMP291]